MSDQAKEPSQWAKDAAKKCMNWLMPDDDPPTLVDKEKSQWFIQQAIDAATAQKDDMLSFYKAENENHKDQIEELKRECKLWAQTNQHSELAHEQKNQRIEELATLVDQAMRVMGQYINTPETERLKEAWAKLKQP